MKSIYTYYKERLIEISGRNRSLYLKNFNKKNGYDLGKLICELPDGINIFNEMIFNDSHVPFNIISKETKVALQRANGLNEKYPSNLTFDTEEEKSLFEKQKKEFLKNVIFDEVESIKLLKREIEDIEKETGRYELYLCYPFVYGSVRDNIYKAPLFMFPVIIDVIDDNNINCVLKANETIKLNKALIYSLAESLHLNIHDMDMEFDSIANRFNDINGVLNYLKSYGIKIEKSPTKKIFPFNKVADPTSNDNLEIKNVCLLSRHSVANSIYSDYSKLEKTNSINDSISELLNLKEVKAKRQKPVELYLINNIDYAQEEVVKKVNNQGSMVIYGPPGTGKSQTIVNVISDCIAKKKKVLVVSQKKAALEVINNRLMNLNRITMFMTDTDKNKKDFYTRCFNQHEIAMNYKVNEQLEKDYEEVCKNLNSEIDNLNVISHSLNSKTPFGISLQEMYANSYKLGKKSNDYVYYKQLIKDKKIMALNYPNLVEALSVLHEKDKVELYYNYIEEKNSNPFIGHLKDNLSVHVVSEAQARLKKLASERIILFDIINHKYARQIATYYYKVKNDRNITPLVKMVAKYEYPNLDKTLKVCTVLFPFYPFAKMAMVKKEKIIKQEMYKTLEAIEEYVEDYDFLKSILTEDGYLMALDGILNGNNLIWKTLLTAVNKYIKLKDINAAIKHLNSNQKLVLDFAYQNTDTFAKYQELLNKILPMRIYYEIDKYEQIEKEKLFAIVDFENTRIRIAELNNKKIELSKKLAEQSFINLYRKETENSKLYKDYLYQISKKQNFWPIRKSMEVYGDFLLKLFPCWLLSPENVCSILPLVKNLFDVVIFDEASQIFIENTLPSIYRGSTIVVAGDAKQLRPTTTFMKRYMGSVVDDDMDYSTQAALEVESLLDLAVSRYNSVHITYHYRSMYEELIDFSNKAFYGGNLQISPNVAKSSKTKPIERVLVPGKWMNRKNPVEAKAVVDLIKKVLKNRKNNETIGVISFNSEQDNCIKDLLEKQCYNDSEFRKLYDQECNRIEDGQDVSIFIKNLENVQGDERDIIIFSIGYAENEQRKVNVSFGSLSNEGGENRLNVAITRAKKKIYVVTSIEPEQLKVENTKYAGPKLLKSYLAYVRAVANNDKEDVKNILNSICESKEDSIHSYHDMPTIQEQIAERINKFGYIAETNLGNSDTKVPLAIYDKKNNRYVLGIEIDQLGDDTDYTPIERYYFKNQFLKSKGWKTMSVWARDWWHNPTLVINSIIAEIEKIEQNEKCSLKISKVIKE